MSPTAREQTEADRRIRAVVAPPSVCPWCCQEQGQVVPTGSTNALCERHYRQLQQEVRR